MRAIHQRPHVPPAHAHAAAARFDTAAVAGLAKDGMDLTSASKGHPKSRWGMGRRTISSSSRPALAISVSTSSTPAQLYWCRCRFVCASGATFQTFGFARPAALRGRLRSARTQRNRVRGGAGANAAVCRDHDAYDAARCALSGLAIPEEAERMERHDAARQCPVPLRAAAVLPAAGFSSRIQH